MYKKLGWAIFIRPWVGRDFEELAPDPSDLLFFVVENFVSQLKKMLFIQKHFLFSGFFSPKMFIAYEVEWSNMLPGT